MNRRETVVTLLTFGALMVPARVFAQQRSARVARIAALFNGPQNPEKPNVEMFMRGLHEHGYAEGRNLALDLRYGNSEIDRLPEIVRELIERGPDVLMLQGSQAIWAGKRATSTIPIVMVSVADPVGQGLVASLGRPGGNITGLAIVSEIDVAKRLQLLGEVVPKAARLGYLTNLSNPALPAVWQNLNAAAKQLGVTLFLHNAKNAAELDAGLAAIAKQRLEGIMVEADALLSTSRKKIVEFLLREKIPSIWASGLGAADGGLMSYGSNFSEHWRKAVPYVDRILKGAQPRELPIEQPMVLQLVINLKTADSLGIKIPQLVLMRADRVIE